MLDPEKCKKSILALDALGSATVVLVKAAELIKTPDADVRTVCALLRNDGPMTVDIIRLSNSARYAPARPHSNLLSAASMIGYRELLRLINVSVSRRLFARDLPAYRMTAHSYWSTSVSGALLMAHIAGELGLDAEDAHTIGILHPTGQLLINQVVEDLRYPFYWDCVSPIEEWERKSVGFDYAEAGAMLLDRWHFPETVCDVIRRQLSSEGIGNQASFLGILQFVLSLLPAVGAGFEKEDWEMPGESLFLEETGLDADRIRELTTECRMRYNEIERMTKC